MEHRHRRVGFRPGLAAALAAVLLAAGSGLSVGAAPNAPVPSVGDVDFVAQQYHDVLNRHVDQAGLDYWVGRLRAGTPRTAMVEQLMRSPEFDTVVAPVARLYAAYFGRIADASGVTYWVGSLQRGVKLSQVSAAFARSQEFVATYGQLDDAHFVTLVYGNVLGRAPDGGGQVFWSGELASGRADRGRVMLAFSESVENKHATAARTTVTTAYLGLLRRAPDPGGLNHWVGQLRRGVPASDLIGGILSSAEYDARMRAGEWSALETINGAPVRWNPCQPIRYVTNLANAPAFARASLETAIAQIEQASGLDLVWAGDTSEMPSNIRVGSGDVLIVFASAHDFAMPEGVAGWGQPRSVPTSTGGRVYATGQVVVRTSSAANPWTYGMPTPNSLERFLMHELGHVVGLGHVDRTTEMMTDLGYGYPPGSGPGDRRGLAAVGRAAGCVTL